MVRLIPHTALEWGWDKIKTELGEDDATTHPFDF